MRKLEYIALLFLFITAVFAGCDKVDGPYIENVGGGNIDTGTVAIRKILLEDFHIFGLVFY